MEEDGQSTPYAAFLVDNCESAARNVILVCAETGWGNFIGVKLKEKVRSTQARANKFHEEMVDWWEQLKEEAVVTPARELDETMEGLQRLISMASAVRERLNTSIEINRVSLENDKLLLECIARENPEERESDEGNRVVKDLMKTLESHRKKMKVDNAVIREFLINIVNRLDSMDEAAKGNPALMKYMYSEESVEAIMDTLPMRLKRMCNEQLKLWPKENGVYEDGTRVLGSNNAEFRKHREIVKQICEYFSPGNNSNSDGIPIKSLTVLMGDCKLHQLAVQRAIWRTQEEWSSDSDSSDEESLRSYPGTAEGVQANAEDTPESPKES